MAYGYFKPDHGIVGSTVVAIVAAWVLILGGRTIVAMRSE